MSPIARRTLRSALRGVPVAPGLLIGALWGAAAQPADGKLPPGAAATASDNSSVGSAGRTPNVAYPQAPTATPAAEGADRALPPTQAEKDEQKLR